MVIQITRQFEKDVQKELDKTVQLQLADLIEELQRVATVKDIRNLKKLKGYKSAYRIKFGEYRIGFILEGDTILLSRIMNRKEIYRYFP